MSGQLPDLRGYDLEQLQILMKEWGQPAFRAGQLFHHLQAEAVGSYDDMHDLPQALRELLRRETVICCPRVVAEHISAAADTAKLLLEFADGERVEMALMLYARKATRDRATCCVSCQSGCAMGCRFCATGMFDRFRNLTAAEIVTQVQIADRLARRLGFEGVSNLVYMGMGEPLANSVEVLKSIRLLNDSRGLNIGARRITLSTCGLVPKIREMEGWGLQVGLAVSLHAADPKLRKKLMPGASRWSPQELIEACEHFRAATGRRVTAEYALIAGVNDDADSAHKLGQLLTEKDILVNIIPANSLPERGVAAADAETRSAFCRILDSYRIPWQVRESRGRDIEAACGQLRKREQC